MLLGVPAGEAAGCVAAARPPDRRWRGDGPGGDEALNLAAVEVSPWALREGIILHYLQTRLNESLVLPLQPLDQVNGEDPGTPRWDANRDRPLGGVI